jgi:hypothetical protein
VRTLLAGLVLAAVLPAAAGGKPPDPPNTTISSGPPPIVASDSATFTFGSSQEGSTFACALDSAVFQNCGSPATISVSDGEHRFFVIAIRDGDTDPTPAAWTWTADTTPPKAVVKHQVDVGYRRLVLRWGSPLSAGADSVTVLQSGSPSRPPSREIYRGGGSRFVITGFANGVYRRYRIIASDKAGNVSPAVDVVVKPSALLLAPHDGARVPGPPLLRWRAAPGAAYYNVQLFRRGQKLLSTWPRTPQLPLTESWTYLGQERHLAPGRYTWFVWPGFGPLARGSYGSLLGQGSFDVR